MTNHLISLQRLARLSNNDTDELDDDFVQFLIDELDQPTSPAGSATEVSPSPASTIIFPQ